MAATRLLAVTGVRLYGFRAVRGISEAADNGFLRTTLSGFWDFFVKLTPKKQKSVLTPRQNPPTGLTCRLVVATGTRTHVYRTSCLPEKLNA